LPFDEYRADWYLATPRRVARDSQRMLHELLIERCGHRG